MSNNPQAPASLPVPSEVFESLLANLPVCLLRKDVEGRFTYANDRFAQTLGCSATDILGRVDADFYPPELARRFRESDQRVFTTGKTSEQVETNRDVNGQEIRVQVLRGPVRDAEGQVVGVQVMFWDVTDRQRAQEATQRALRETEELVASLSAALIGVEQNGDAIRWNGGAERMFGLKASQVCGRPWFGLPLGWDWSRVRQAAVDCLVQRRTVELMDLECVTPGNPPRVLHLVFNPGPETTTPGDLQYTVLATDITSLKLLESQLRQAQKLEAIGQLSAGIAHEINSPTQFINDNLEFVTSSCSHLWPALRALAEAKPELSTAEAAATLAKVRTLLPSDLELLLQEVPDSLRLASEGVGRISAIVGAMKVFSHPDVSTMVSTDLRRTVESTLLVSRNEWKYVAETAMEFDPALPLVPCFPGDINQVLLNLVVNAAHAIGESLTFRGGRKGLIRVSTRRQGEWAEVRVQDNGNGIPEAIRHRIFEPFFTTKEVGRGTGQGLFISHRVITHKHHGTITFESVPGEGTTFIVRLPLFVHSTRKS